MSDVSYGDSHFRCVKNCWWCWLDISVDHSNIIENGKYRKKENSKHIPRPRHVRSLDHVSGWATGGVDGRTRSL